MVGTEVPVSEVLVLVEIELAVREGIGGIADSEGEENNKYKFLPMAQISSQLFESNSFPWVRPIHAIVQARSVIASMNEPYATGSSCARVGRVFSSRRGRILVEDCDLAYDELLTSIGVLYEDKGERMTG